MICALVENSRLFGVHTRNNRQVFGAVRERRNFASAQLFPRKKLNLAEKGASRVKGTEGWEWNDCCRYLYASFETVRPDRGDACYTVRQTNSSISMSSLLIRNAMFFNSNADCYRVFSRLSCRSMLRPQKLNKSRSRPPGKKPKSVSPKTDKSWEHGQSVTDDTLPYCSCEEWNNQWEARVSCVAQALHNEFNVEALHVRHEELYSENSRTLMNRCNND